MPQIRRPPFRHIETGRRMLIGCEGKTEAIYFDCIRQHRRLSSGRIVVIDTASTDPLGIVNAVLARRDSYKTEKRWTDLDESWAVFDGDEHRDAVPQNWNDAVQTARSRKVNLAISNPAIELWFLLHFQEQNAH